MSRMMINGVAFDPSSPKLATLSALSAPVSASRYIIVQTRAPLSAADRAALKNSGAEILEAVEGNGLVCSLTAPNLQAIRALSFVAWAASTSVA